MERPFQRQTLEARKRANDGIVNRVSGRDMQRRELDTKPLTYWRACRSCDDSRLIGYRTCTSE